MFCGLQANLSTVHRATASMQWDSLSNLFVLRAVRAVFCVIYCLSRAHRSSTGTGQWSTTDHSRLTGHRRAALIDRFWGRLAITCRRPAQARGGFSTSALGDRVSKGWPVTGKKFEGHVFKCAVFDIKPTYNH